MMKLLNQKVLPAITLAVLSVALFASGQTAYAFGGTIQNGADSARGSDQSANLFGNSGIFQTITNVLLFILGAVSVIMIIIGGLRYVVSGGNSANVTAAKNTILYAIVGIIVAILAYAIVNFVLGSFTAGGASGGTNI